MAIVADPMTTPLAHLYSLSSLLRRAFLCIEALPFPPFFLLSCGNLSLPIARGLHNLGNEMHTPYFLGRLSNSLYTFMPPVLRKATCFEVENVSNTPDMLRREPEVST